MSAYTKTKSISKFLIYFSLLAVVIFGGSFFVSKSRVGADTVMNSYLSLNIQASPSTVQKGGIVNVKIIIDDPSHETDQINKVILYACSGGINSVAMNDSSGCTIQNADGQTEDAIKTVFTIGQNLTLVNGTATVSTTWDTSGTPPGDHALMVKAFGGPSGNSYIFNSKTALAIQVTAASSTSNSNNNTNTTGNPTNSNTQNGTFSSSTNSSTSQFTNRASENPSGTGSPLTDAKALADRLVKVLLFVIGGLSVIAIIIGGIQYITASGDQQKAEKGKKTVLYAMIGIAIATLVFVIENAVLDIINRILK